MKARNIIENYIRAGVGAIVLACFYPPALASNTAKDVSREIGELRGTVVSAEVWLAPRQMESRYAITEQDLPTVACPYRVTEKKDLDPLLDILANAGIVEEAPQDLEDARIAVYLRTGSGKTIGLVMSPDYSNAPASGSYNRTTPVVVKNGFEADIRLWAAQRKSNKLTGPCKR